MKKGKRGEKSFHNKDLFLGFSIDRFKERIRSDRRFIVNIEVDVSLSSSGEKRNEQGK